MNFKMTNLHWSGVSLSMSLGLASLVLTSLAQADCRERMPLKIGELAQVTLRCHPVSQVPQPASERYGDSLCFQIVQSRAGTYTSYRTFRFLRAQSFGGILNVVSKDTSGRPLQGNIIEKVGSTSALMDFFHTDTGESWMDKTTIDLNSMSSLKFEHYRTNTWGQSTKLFTDKYSCSQDR